MALASHRSRRKDHAKKTSLFRGISFSPGKIQTQIRDAVPAEAGMIIGQITCLLTAAALLLAQGAAPPSEREVGTVRQVDAAKQLLIVVGDAGGERRVVVPSHVTVRGVAPGQKDLSSAQVISLSEVQPGDRVVVRGTSGPDRVLTAATVVIMSRSDVTRKRETDAADWRQRGISGKVTLIDPVNRQLTIAGGPRLSASTVVVRQTNVTILRRYRPDSVRFADALPAKFEDVRVGDQLHALGNRPGDGVLEAEQIVFGSFRTFVAVVSSVDVPGLGLTVKDLGSDKPVPVRLTPASVLRRLTPEAAQTLAANHGGQSKPDNDDDGAAKPAAKGGGSAADIQALMVRLPLMQMEEMKPGDVVIICASFAPHPAAVTAFTILGSAEALLRRSAEEQREILGSWELSLEPDQP
jgi:hypothetical protein